MERRWQWKPDARQDAAIRRGPRHRARPGSDRRLSAKDCGQPGEASTPIESSCTVSLCFAADDPHAHPARRIGDCQTMRARSRAVAGGYPRFGQLSGTAEDDAMSIGCGIHSAVEKAGLARVSEAVVPNTDRTGFLLEERYEQHSIHSTDFRRERRIGF